MFTKNRGHEDSWRMKNRVKGISSWNSFFLYQSSWNEDKGQLSCSIEIVSSVYELLVKVRGEFPFSYGFERGIEKKN